MSRPTSVTLTGKKLKEVLNTFDVLDAMTNNDTLTVTQEELFPGEKKKWNIFYDLVMPEESYKYTAGDMLFVFGKNDVIKVNPKRATKNDVLAVMDFLSSKKEGAARNYLRTIARMQPNAPGKSIQKPKKAITYRYGGKRSKRSTRRR